VSELDGLVEVVATLRAPGGCPWDAEQTHRSLVRYLVEECYELVEAIEAGDVAHLKEELGDVLLQIVFHADIAAGTPAEGFDIQDVAAAVAAKMRARHPHVFGQAGPRSSAEVVAAWEDVKAVEKPERSSVLDGVPWAMPALALADKVLGKAARAGVQPHRVAGPEAAEPEALVDEEALGERLLALVAAARERGLDPERALRERVRGLAAQVRAREAAPAREAAAPAREAAPAQGAEPSAPLP